MVKGLTAESKILKIFNADKALILLVIKNNEGLVSAQVK